MSTMARLFGINQNKTAELTTLLFEPCYKYMCNQVENLYQQTLKLQNKKDVYYGLYIGNVFFYRPEEKIAEHDTHQKWIRIDESLNANGQGIEDFLYKVRKDVRFIQMWLSLVINVIDPVTTRSKLPTTLANLHPLYKNTDFTELSVPPGKELLWKQAEEKISFYLGLKLVL